MDLYAALNLTRSASAADVERAYRRLLRRYHPGLNPGDRVAAELYQKIQEAYGVLGDPDRRGEYDRSGMTAPVVTVAAIAFEGFDFSAHADDAQATTFSELFSDVFQSAAERIAAPERGADIELELTLSFEDAARGAALPVSVLRQERCPACDGLGSVPRPPGPCPQCQGHGMLRSARGHMVFTKPCEPCDGTGRLVRQRCRQCQGNGVYPRSEIVTIGVPPGVEDGARLVVPGRGHAGAHRGPAGDVYVNLTIAPHPLYRREGRDIVFALPITVAEAGLGADVDVPAFDGQPAVVHVPAGTQSGERIRVRGRGIPAEAQTTGPGDLVAEVRIVLPPVKNARARELLRELGRLHETDVRGPEFGLRSAGAEVRK